MSTLLRSLARQANQEFFFIRIKAKPNKKTNIPIYIKITSLVVVSGSSICSSFVKDNKTNNPYSKGSVDNNIKKTTCHLPLARRQTSHSFCYSYKAKQLTLPSCRFSGFIPPHPKWVSIMHLALTVPPPPNAATANKCAFPALSRIGRNITANVYQCTDMDQPNYI